MELIFLCGHKDRQIVFQPNFSTISPLSRGLYGNQLLVPLTFEPFCHQSHHTFSIHCIFSIQHYTFWQFQTQSVSVEPVVCCRIVCLFVFSAKVSCESAASFIGGEIESWQIRLWTKDDRSMMKMGGNIVFVPCGICLIAD